MPANTPEGMPYPLATEPVRDGAAATEALARSAGTTLILPLNTASQRISRLGMMLSQSLLATFNSSGRYILNVSATFSSVYYAHAVSATFPAIISVPSILPGSVELFAQWPDGTSVVGQLELRVIVLGVRK